MIRLLNIEIHKLKYNKANRTLILIYFSLLTSTALIASIKFNFAQFDFNLADMGVFNFPYIWHLNTYLSSSIKFFLLFVIVSMMSNEYSNKTLKQNLVDGLSKKEFILSKFYSILALSFLSTIFVFIISLTLGLLYSDYAKLNLVFTDIDYLIAYFIKHVGFLTFGLFFAILIRKSALAIAAMIIWSIIESSIKGILLWNLDSFADSIIQFLPLESLSNLIKEPFGRLSAVKTVANQIGESINKDFSVQFSDLIIASCWSLIFIYLSHKILKTRDL